MGYPIKVFMARVNLIILREVTAMFLYSLGCLVSWVNLENHTNQEKVVQKVKKVLQKKKL